MKFARYLDDTQTPEWKKAYIDYRGLKRQLGIIRAQAPQQLDASSSIGTTEADHTLSSPSNHEERDEDTKEMQFVRGTTTSSRIPNHWVATVDGSTSGDGGLSAHSAAPPVRRRTSGQERRPSLSLTVAALPQRVTGTSSNAPSQQTPLPPRTPRSPPVFPFFRDSAGSSTPPPLHTILSNLPALHAKFFDLLDAELDKVETFYAEREKEMRERGKKLREQLNELGLHRQKFYESNAHSKAQSWAKKAHLSVPAAFSSFIHWQSEPTSKTEEPHVTGGNGIVASESGRGGRLSFGDTPNSGTQPTDHRRRSGSHSGTRTKESMAKGSDSEKPSKESSNFSPKSNTASSPKPTDESARSPPKRANSLPRLLHGGGKHTLDPHEYQHAKRRLRKAVVEHYRGLEVLNNYRILNLTGFRKALKKYEKITKVPVLDAYMKEKVEPSAFASGALVSTMLKEMEDMFAMRFERGDRKKAIDRLRVGPLIKSHHFSTFRSGLWLGLSLPAIISGAYLSFQESVRAQFPSWNILLFIYSILVVPILLALLIGINVVVWARERINYVFIFELDPRSRLDHHEYFELPAFHLCTLAHAFWLSLAQIGPPMLWPLIWMAVTLVVMFNPIRSFMWGHARWWTIKNIAKLGASGIWKVEFTDFWLGDQFCSLVYSLSNLYFVGCFYTQFFPGNFPPSLTDPGPSRDTTIARGIFQKLWSSAYDPSAQAAWETCGAAQNWGWYFLLGVLPFIVRFVQSLRRYWDSRLPTHLINAGKYGMGMIYYFFYYYWRHKQDVHYGASYVLWCFTATAYALYACAWDFLMDWSMCKPHARYPFLRPELVYTSQIPVRSPPLSLVILGTLLTCDDYNVGSHITLLWYRSHLSFGLLMLIVNSIRQFQASNLIIRFVWLTYIPTQGAANLTLRTFIAAMLEMLRRVQWNFYRLENEHLGNMDQYRVTREVPLPYSFDAHSNDEEEEERDEREESGESVSRGVGSWIMRQVARVKKGGAGG